MNCTFPLALTFLSKVPWPRPVVAGPEDLARSLFWFPWVGAILGLIFLGAWSIFLKVLPHPAAAALLVCLTVWITGGLHLDGLADTVDGLGGGQDPEARRRIMKDSRVGAFGVLALILALLLKFAFFLAAADEGWRGQIILYPVLSRWGMVYLAYCSDYARPEGGLGQAMTSGVSPQVRPGQVAARGSWRYCCSATKAWCSGPRGRSPGLAGEPLFSEGPGWGHRGRPGRAANEILEVAVLGGGFALELRQLAACF